MTWTTRCTNFKRASGLASEAVFCDIERRSGIGVDELNEAYGEILRTAQSSHFTQPKTSREYRAARFGALLDGFAQGPGPQLDHLLDVYDTALGEALKRAGCEPHEVLYVGDSVDRDMVPMTALGIACVYVGDGELPAGLSAMKLDLAAVGKLLDVFS